MTIASNSIVLGAGGGGGGGAGLTQNQVDARVRSGVEDWAEEGNTSDIPLAKLGNAPGGTDVVARAAAAGAQTAAVDAHSVATAAQTTADAAQATATSAASTANQAVTAAATAQVTADGKVTSADAQALIADWAETSNTDPIPAGKLTNAPSGGGGGLDTAGVNALIADWAEEGNSDQIPLNKLGNAPSGGGGGLSQAQVDARVQAGVSDWAETTNTDPIPANKLANAPAGGGGLNQGQVDARVQAGVEDWAETGNTDIIPTAKLPASTGGATDLSVTRVAGAVTVASSTGTDAVLSAASTTQAGVMSAADKLRLDNAQNQANVDARVQAGVLDWAEQGNTDAIPASKLTNVSAPSITTTEEDVLSDVDVRLTTESVRFLQSITFETRYKDRVRVFEPTTDIMRSWSQVTTLPIPVNGELVIGGYLANNVGSNELGGAAIGRILCKDFHDAVRWPTFSVAPTDRDITGVHQFLEATVADLYLAKGATENTLWVYSNHTSTRRFYIDLYELETVVTAQSSQTRGFVTGTTVTPTTATVVSSVTAGTPGPPVHTDTMYAAARASADGSDFTAADFLASGATSATGTQIDFPSYTGDHWIGIAVPVARGEPTSIRQPGQPLSELIGVFERQGGSGFTLDIGGEAHIIMRSTVTDGGASSGVTYEVT